MKHTTLSKKIALTLKSYAKTQLLILLIVTAVSWIILTVLGIRYALLLSVITGALSAVPFFGITISALITAVVAVFDGTRFLPTMHPLFEGATVVIIYTLMNQLMDLFLTPYLMSKTSNIHPLLIFSAVIIGTSLFGIFGTILAVPAVLIARTILKHYEVI